MNITVYLGASDIEDRKIIRATQDLGHWIGSHGHRLIYGGSKSGLMGILADSVLEKGGQVVGIEPEMFIDSELQHDGITELIVTKDFNERKDKMMEMGDCIVVMPGGLKRVVDSFRTAKSGLVMPCPADFETRDPHVVVFDPRRVIQQIFDRFFNSTLRLLGISLAVLSVLLLVLFRRDVLRYAGPLGWSIAATLGVLGWLGIPVTNFTLLCFFVMVGLGLDYVIFQRGKPTSETRRTVLFSFLSSLVGLGLLAFTEFPVTRSMGVTFASGLFFAYVFARMGRDTVPPAEADSKVFEDSGKKAWHEQREQSAGRWRMQFMWCLYAWFGKGVQKLVTIPVMAFIYPFAATARRALRGFYARLADFSAAHARLRSPSHVMLFRHLLGFAWSLADKTDACTLKKNLPKMTVRDDAGWKSRTAFSVVSR